MMQVFNLHEFMYKRYHFRSLKFHTRYSTKMYFFGKLVSLGHLRSESGN